MTEIIFSQYAKKEVDADSYIKDNLEFNRGDLSVRSYHGGTKRSVFAGPNKVSVVVSERQVNVRGSNFWTSWHTIQSLGFYRNRAGYLQPYHSYKAPKGKKWSAEKVNQVWDMLDPNFNGGSDHYRQAVGDTVSQVFREQCNYMLGVKDFTDLYPWAKEYGIIHYKYLPKHLRTAYRSTSTPEFATRIFGKKRTNASLMWALKKSDPIFIHMAHDLRNSVDSNKLKFIMQNEFDPSALDMFNPKEVYKIDLGAAANIIPSKIWNNLASEPITEKGIESVVRIARNPNLAVAALDGVVPREEFYDKSPKQLLEDNAGCFKDWTNLSTGIAKGGIVPAQRW